MEPIVLNGYHTLIIATLVLLVGRYVVNKVKFLRDFNIPEAVTGGLIAAVIIFVLYKTQGIAFQFEKSVQTTFMLAFFASIGLSADFKRLKQGGIPLVVYLAVVGVFLLVQNGVGAGLAALLGLDPLIGLLTGSITLTGGHGTGGAWGPIFSEQYGVANATEIAMAAATFGLVSGGLVGGPLARRLVNKMKRDPIPQGAEVEAVDPDKTEQYNNDTFEVAHGARAITANSTIETVALFAACLAFSSIMIEIVPKDWKIPQFVWALGFGVVLRNVLTLGFKFDMFDRAIDVFGNAALNLFLAISLMSIKLWELADIAGPMLIILLAQTVVMILYAYFITYPLMGRDYDAAILSAGHCGFALGSTATAIANMQSVTEKFGPSHKSFLIVPLVGAFFIDILNVGAITWFIDLIR